MPPGAAFKVPRLYKAAAKVASAVKEENGNLEQLVQLYNKKTNTKALAALVSKTLYNEGLLDKIIKNSKILINEANAIPWLFKILIAELLLGKQRLPVGSKPVQTVLAYGPTLRTELLKATGKFRNKRNKYKSQPDVRDQDPYLGHETPSARNQTSVFEKSEVMKPELNTVMLSESKGECVQDCIKSEEDEHVKSRSKQTKQPKNKQKRSYQGLEQLPKEGKISGSKTEKGKHTSVFERSKNMKPELKTVMLSKSRCKATQDFIKLEEEENVKSESQQIKQPESQQQRNYKGSAQLPQGETISVSKCKKRKHNMWTDELSLKKPKVKKATKLHKSQYFE
jgi:hypothetical protein